MTLQMSRGRLVHHDPRSRDYPAPRRMVTASSWLHKLGPVLDQGQINGCTGWSGADWLNSAVAIGNRRRYNKTLLRAFAAVGRMGTPHYLNDKDGLAIYAAATQNDDFSWTYPPTDQGSSGVGVGRALKARGVIDGYQWTFTFDQMLAQSQYQPLLLGTVWTDAMSQPDAKGVIRTGGDAAIKRADDDGEGHEYILRGASRRTGLARIRNHWTDQWGIGGEALISLTELETLIMNWRGDVLVPQLATK